MMIQVDRLKLASFRTKEIHVETEESLMKTDAANWEPITIMGTRVIDGMQRVLVARKHGIKEIPARPLKGS